MDERTGYELTHEAIDLQELERSVASTQHGGIVVFCGVVRERSDDRTPPVVAIEYEAYAAMAVPELRAIVEGAESRFDARVAIRHRLGRVPLGEPSVAIVAAAAHRGAAFDACEFAIDEVKKRVPIWKKEQYVDGTSSWRDGTVLDDVAGDATSLESVLPPATGASTGDAR